MLRQRPSKSMMACTCPTPLAARAKRGSGSIHKLPVGEVEIFAASTRLGADCMAAVSAESFASSSISGKSTSTPMAFGFCALTARMSFASSARGHGQRPCCSSVASSISTSATWLETGNGRRTRKKKSFSFWLSVETGKLRLTSKTSPSKTALSLIHRPQVTGRAGFDLEKRFIFPIANQLRATFKKSADHQINAQPAGFLVKSFPFDAQSAGRLGFVACVLLQHAQNVLPLHVFQRRGRSLVRQAVGADGLAFTFHVSPPDLARRTKNGQPLHQIFQFANVAGPRRIGQHLYRGISDGDIALAFLENLVER